MMARNLVELARASVARNANRPLFGEQFDHTWHWVTYRQWQDDVDALRGGLATLGIQPGDRIAIVSRNGAAWATCAYASYGLGAAFVPMYEAQRPEDWEFILRDCAARVVFGRTPQIVAALEAMRERLPALQHVLQIEGEGARTVHALQALGREHPCPVRDVEPDAVAGFVYTSGTTGLPKGAMLSHRNLCSNIDGTLSAFPLRASDRTVSFLPWAHVYGQVCELHLLVAAGGSTAFNTSTEHLVHDLETVKPTILVAVPRIFNMIHGNLRAKMEHEPRPIRFLFRRGIAASIRRRRGERIGIVDRVWLLLASVLFAAVRKKFGGNLRYAVSGSATLSRDVAEFIDALGIEVYEGYGMTETSPIMALNRPGHRKFGTVGVPIEGVRIDIDESLGGSPGEGEIVVHGPNVMLGYHARPDENARTFTPDGGLRTGDLGRFDADGYLSITGRIKEQYKLENGKYVMPGPLEERLALSPYIKNVMLYGANRPHNVALVVVDRAALPDGADAQKLVQQELDRLGADLRGYERPRACVLIDEPFTVDNGLLTPTLKLKRRVVTERYQVLLDGLYRPAPEPPLLDHREPRRPLRL